MSEMATTVDASRPPSLVEGFDSVWLLDSQLTAEHWRYMWQRFDVRELIDIGRRSGWLDEGSNRDAVLALLERSRQAGYDPLADGLSADEPLKVV